LLLFSLEGRAQCCCPDCPDANPLPVECGDLDLTCDYSQCPGCQAAIPLTDHLWVLAVLGAAGGAWMLMRKRTEGDLA
jgi:hypothetical protein